MFVKSTIYLAASLLWRIKQLRHAARIWAYRRLGAHIGRRVRLYGTLDGVNPQNVSIGDNTVLAVRAHIIAHGPTKKDRKVVIGANCYIGYGALVLPGVTIGDNCLIGAGSVVTRDIPAGSVAAGNPARVLHPRDSGELNDTVRRIEQGRAIGG